MGIGMLLGARRLPTFRFGSSKSKICEGPLLWVFSDWLPVRTRTGSGATSFAPGTFGKELSCALLAMATSILDSLRYSNFIAAEGDVASSLGYGSTEGKSGVPRYDGDPGRFAEWQFRVRTRQLKEQNLGKDKLKELGPLGLRLLDGLSGHALQIAQLMDNIEKLSEDDGAQQLMDHLQTQLRPRREQQARELYEAGAMVGGLLARQGPETMAQYVLRRRAWYRALTDMSDELKLPDLILAEQLLNNAGLTEDQKLMIRTTLAGKLTFNGVAQELVNQHPRIHERNRHFSRQLPDRGHRSSSWNWSKGKGHSKDRPRMAFYQDYDYHDHEGNDGGYDEDLAEQHSYLGYQYDDEHDGDWIEAGDFTEEGVAMLCEQGLDFDDPEACETAAEVLQADAEAYWTKKGASQKGRKGFKAPPFEISGSFSLDEKRARLQQLKAKTTCRKCGAVGHWSGDAQCPLAKGKGKAHLPRAGAPPSTSSSTSSKAPPRGTSQPGRQTGKSRPRTVYFSIKEHGKENDTAYLAYHNHGNYNQAPPPECLRDPAPLPARGPPGRL